MTDMDLIREDNKALHGTVPYRPIVAKGIPGEDTVAIGQQQAIYAQITSHCYTPVILSEMRVREPELTI